MLDDLFGVRAMRRARVLSAFLIALLFMGGCALFLFESQTFGSIAILGGAGWAALWLYPRQAARTGDDLVQLARSRQRTLIGLGAALVGAGWLAYFIVWEELGLLLVVLGAIPLAFLIVTAKHDPLASPLDGPPFGDTGST